MFTYLFATLTCACGPGGLLKVTCVGAFSSEHSVHSSCACDTHLLSGCGMANPQATWDVFFRSLPKPQRFLIYGCMTSPQMKQLKQQASLIWVCVVTGSGRHLSRGYSQATGRDDALASMVLCLWGHSCVCFQVCSLPGASSQGFLSFGELASLRDSSVRARGGSTQG